MEMTPIEPLKKVYEGKLYRSDYQRNYEANIRRLGVLVYHNINVLEDDVHSIAHDVMDIVHGLENCAINQDEGLLVEKQVWNYHVRLRFRSRIYNEAGFFRRMICCAPNREELCVEYTIS